MAGVGHLELAGVDYTLPDGRPLLNDVSFRVGTGKKAALIGANGAGKSTIMRLITGAITPEAGTVTCNGSLGVMSQFLGEGTLRDLLLSVAPPRIREAARLLDRAEASNSLRNTSHTQVAYATALAQWGDAGGYEAEVQWDVCTTAAIGIPFVDCADRDVSTLSGGEQKRLMLEALFRGPDEILLLDEPDNFLDVPTKEWLEGLLTTSKKTVLFVSHDRELLARAADQIITLELGLAGNTAWIHPGGFATYEAARVARYERLDELRRRWDEEHTKLKDLVALYKQKAEYNSGMASRYRAAQTRLARFEEIGPPEAQAREQALDLRLRGGRTGKRALVCTDLELVSLMQPFDLEVWYGDRVAVLGSNGSGKSHFLRLLAAGGTTPEAEHEPVSDIPIEPVEHTGRAKLGARVRPGYFAQTHRRDDLADRTLIEILNRGDEHRAGLDFAGAIGALSRYELSYAAQQNFATLSGGQQARFQILLLELSGATMLLLDEPTDNLDLISAEALQHAIAAFDGTVIAITHDRWFAADFDRFIIFGSNGQVYESPTPVWNEARVVRPR